MLKIRVLSENTQLDVNVNVEEVNSPNQLAATVAKVIFAKLSLSRLAGSKLIPANKPLSVQIATGDQFIQVVESFKVNRFDASLQSRIGKALYYSIRFNDVIRQLELITELPTLELSSKELAIINSL